MDAIVKDSSIWQDPSNLTVANRLDGLIRIGIVKSAFNDSDTGELRYLVEIQSNAKKINMNCRMMRRFGGVYNYEDYINHGYKTTDSVDPVTGYNAKAGDAVLVGQFNGQGREGIILGGLTHAAHMTTIQASDGPQYDAEFNGIHTNINTDGEWTLTFKGQPTNLAGLNNSPSGPLPAPTYDTTIGSSFMKFDATGSFTVTDNAISDSQYFNINKSSGTITIAAGQATMMMSKGPQSIDMTCNALTLTSTNTINQSTSNFTLMASSTASIDSPKVAIGHGAIELLDQLSQLIDALGNVDPISPIGPCTPLNATGAWPQVVQIQSKINQIKGSL